MKAYLKNYRQSPRKVRLVADLVRGKRVDRALMSLRFLTKRAAEPVKSLIETAMANAGVEATQKPERFYIREIRVDEGITMKRYMPRARGSAAPIRKRLSHIAVALAERK